VRKLLFGCLLMLSSALALANVALPVAADQVLEKHVMALSSELRCLVCQNQTIADSHADLAIDLRNQVREKLAQGMSDQAVVDYMVERYGDFVLYRPPFKATTWLLWCGPFLLMIGGVAFLVRNLRRRRPQVDALPPAETERAANLLRATTDTKETK
jgi:cytochrome c-type biogenesis protein CcmH